jgi:ferritin-like metal-binding protein YciE
VTADRAVVDDPDVMSVTRHSSASNAVRLLDQTLQEEKKIDESLTSLAEAAVNLAAAV